MALKFGFRTAGMGVAKLKYPLTVQAVEQCTTPKSQQLFVMGSSQSVSHGMEWECPSAMESAVIPCISMCPIA